MGPAIIEQFLKYFWVVTILFLVTAAILAAQLTSDLVARRLWVAEVGDAPVAVAGAAPVARQRLGEYRVIQKRNLFNANPKPPPVAAPAPVATPEVSDAVPPPKSLPPLNLVLIGTAVVQDGGSLAVIELDREVKVVRESQPVAEGAILTQVFVDRILVDRAGTVQEYLLYPPETAKKKPAARERRQRRPRKPEAAPAEDSDTIRSVGEDKWLIDAREVEEATNNMSRLMTQVRVVPNFTDGQADGFKVFAIRPGSLFAKIGLQNGDVLKRINGVEIEGPTQALEAYEQLKNETSIQIDLTRRNENRSFNYEIR